MVRTGTRSGGVPRASPVQRLVSQALANVAKALRAERADAKRALESSARAARTAARQQRELEQRARRRRVDAQVVTKLLAVGQCTVRLTLRGARQLVLNDWTPRQVKQALMRRTCWVLCAECELEDRHPWHNPRRLWAPEALAAGKRHRPCCERHRARRRLQQQQHHHQNDPNRDDGEHHHDDGAERTEAAAVAPIITLRDTRVLPRTSVGAADVRLVPSPPPPPPAPPHDDDGRDAPPDDAERGDPYGPWLRDPWGTYLRHRPVARLAAGLAAI